MKRLLNLLTKLFSRPKNWLSWVVGLTVAIAMIIIVVPGTPVWPEHRRGAYIGSGVSPRPTEPPQWTVTFWSDQAPVPEAPLYLEAHDYSHGWPLEWMRQTHRMKELDNGGYSYDYPGETCWIPLPMTVNGTRAAPITWATSDAWPWSGDYQWLRIGVLLLDLVIASAIVLGGTRLFDLWLTRRSKGWSFGLTGALLVTAASCVVLGWWQYHVKLQKRESELIEETEMWREYQEAYCGPIWLGKLIGNPAYLPFCVHRVEKNIELEDMSYEELNSLNDLTYLRRVTIHRSFTGMGHRQIEIFDAPKIVSVLAGFRHLRQINFNRETLPEQIPEFLALTNIDRFNVSRVGLTEEDYQQLRQLDPRVLAVSSEEFGFSRNTRPTFAKCWLDLSDRDVTRNDLEGFIPVRHRISQLILGSQADIDALANFLQGCPKTFCLSLGEIQLSSQQLCQLFTKPNKCEDGESHIQFDVQFQQGGLTETDLTNWLSHLDNHPYSKVRVLNSNFSRETVRDLQEAFAEQDIFFEAFRGTSLSDSPIEPAESDDY
ncbi:hypothetical protein N9Y42_09725 [Mariniblastus sp.]|nr:hypothetical protein [Mariniblastus sp.]